MENLKIKVNGKKDGDLAQELFFKLGYGFDGCKIKTIQSLEYTSDYYFFAYSHDMDLTHSCDYGVFMNKAHKEITLQELRDMVVLNRNNPKDANVYQDGDISCLYDLYLTGNKELYFYHCGKKAWILSNLNHDKDYYELLKPIKKDVMKESLNEKIATAEVARQEEKHSHYKKDVSHLNVIDPYRIADLYNLHPCADHIMKKSLCAGNRGHKDTLRDIQDIIDTAERWKQMIEEDSNEL